MNSCFLSEVARAARAETSKKGIQVQGVRERGNDFDLGACSVKYSWLNESTGCARPAEVEGWLTYSFFGILIFKL